MPDTKQVNGVARYFYKAETIRQYQKEALKEAGEMKQSRRQRRKIERKLKKLK